MFKTCVLLSQEIYQENKLWLEEKSILFQILVIYLKD